MTTMTIRGIPVKEIAGADSEGRTPLTRTSRRAYTTADQKSSLTALKLQLRVESLVVLQRIRDIRAPCLRHHRRSHYVYSELSRRVVLGLCLLLLFVRLLCA